MMLPKNFPTTAPWGATPHGERIQSVEKIADGAFLVETAERCGIAMSGYMTHRIVDTNALKRHGDLCAKLWMNYFFFKDDCGIAIPIFFSDEVRKWLAERNSMREDDLKEWSRATMQRYMPELWEEINERTR